MAQTFKKLAIYGGGVNDTFINPQIAPDFSTSTAYAIGKYVTYQGQTYRFTAAKTAGAWDATKVTAVNLAGDTDTTLTVSGMAADAKAAGDLAIPAANLSNVNTTAIPANSDLNDYITAGNFRVTTSNASTLANAPENIGARLFVMTRLGTTTVNQIWVSERNMFFRGYTTGTWTNWKNCTADALHPYTNRVTAAYATSIGWSTIADMPANKMYQLGNDLPDSFGLAYNSDYSSLYVFQSNLGVDSSTWIRTYIQCSTTKIWLKLGSEWLEIGNSFTTYHETLNAQVALNNNWTSINDLPVNIIYQIGNDLPDTFDLPVENTYSTLMVFKADGTYVNWTKVFFFATTSKLFTKSGNGPWIEIKAQSDSGADYGVLIQNTTAIKIGLYGDSIVAGVGASDYDTAATRGEYIDLSSMGYTHGGFYKYTGHKSWAAQFADYLADRYPNVSVSNNGVPGCTPNSCKTYITTSGTPLDVDVDIAIICVGINARISADSNVTSGLGGIIKFFKNKNIPVFVLTNTPAFDSTSGMNKDDVQIMQLIKSTCDTADIPAYPLYNSVYDLCFVKDVSVSYDSSANKNFLNSDNLHPSDTGHEIIFKAVQSLLKV